MALVAAFPKMSSSALAYVVLLIRRSVASGTDPFAHSEAPGGSDPTGSRGADGDPGVPGELPPPGRELPPGRTLSPASIRPPQAARARAAIRVYRNWPSHRIASRQCRLTPHFMNESTVR